MDIPVKSGSAVAVDVAEVFVVRAPTAARAVESPSLVLVEVEEAAAKYNSNNKY